MPGVRPQALQEEEKGGEGVSKIEQEIAEGMNRYLKMPKIKQHDVELDSLRRTCFDHEKRIQKLEEKIREARE